MLPRAESREPRAESREPRAESRRSRSRSRRLTWLLILAFSGLCLAVANLAHAYLTPSDSIYGVYEWVAETEVAAATDAANWQAPAGSPPLPTDGAHLLFGNKPALANGYWDLKWDDVLGDYADVWVPGTVYTGEVVGLGGATRYASLWFGFGELLDNERKYNKLDYTFTGPAITVGYGTAEIDRLIIAQGFGFGTYTFDLDVLIHEVPGLAFRIHNDIPSIEGHEALIFERKLTSQSGTLIVSGFGYTSINELHGTGTLIKEGEGLLRADTTNYLGELTLRGGALIGAISDDSVLTLAGGVYGLPDATGTFERALGGQGAGKARWLAGESGGFTALDGTALHITLDGGRTLTWGEKDFVSLGSELLFGSATAEGSLYWNNALDLGDPTNSSARTIRLNRKYGSENAFTDPELADFSLYLSEELIAAAGQKLRFIGSGTVVVSADNSAFHGDLEIAGVDLELEGDGHFRDAPHLTISEGGTLAISIGAGESSPLSDNAAITLSSGTLRWDDPDVANATRTLGDIILAGGANRIERTNLANVLRANSLVRDDERSTLLVELIEHASPGDSLMEFTDTTALEGTAIGGIYPWLVVTTDSETWEARSDWGIFEDGKLKAYVNYYTGDEATWNAGHNVDVGEDPVLLSAGRTVNSLRLGYSSLDLEGHTLTIGSGGILVNKDSASGIYDYGNGSTYGAVTTAEGRPLYIQTQGRLTFYAQITGDIDLVKTGAGALDLSSNRDEGYTHQLGSLFIHQGELYLNGARISTTGTITVGDGGSYAALILEIPKDHDPAGPPILSGKPDLRLRGGHDGSKAAELRLIGNHDLRLNALSIEGNSALEFQLPVNGGISRIYSEVFTIDPTGRLIVRGWRREEGEFVGDIKTGERSTNILVQKSSPGLDDYLSQIWFEDYGPATKIDWFEDNNYWEIVPGIRPFPEPSTYGAILAAAGIGLVLWRKRRARAVANKRLPKQTGHP